MAQQDTKRVELDEDWLRDWVAYGFAEMESYLQRHAQFAAYLADHWRATMTTAEPAYIEIHSRTPAPAPQPNPSTPGQPAPAPQPNPPAPDTGPAPAPQPNPHQ
jgi:hypothetical protein